MNIYRVVWPRGGGWSTYDMLIAVADSPAEARNIHPLGKWITWSKEEQDWMHEDGSVWGNSEWGNPREFVVTKIGETKLRTKKAICSSYNSG